MQSMRYRIISSLGSKPQTARKRPRQSRLPQSMPTPQPTSSERWAEIADRSLKITGVATLAGYLFGYLLLNSIHFALWRFVDVRLLSERCLLVALVPALLLAFVRGPILRLRKFLESCMLPLSRLPRWQKGVWFCAFLALLYGPSLAIPPLIHHFGSSSAIIQAAAWILAVAFGSLLFVGLSFATDNNLSKKPFDTMALGDLAPLLPTVVALVFCTILVFLFVPPRIGLLVEQNDLLLSSKAADMLTPCTPPLVTKSAESDSEKLLWVKNLWILEKGSSETVLWSDSCGTIFRISNDYIKGARWLTPFSKTPPAPNTPSPTGH